MRAATPRIMLFGSLARRPSRNAVSWAATYSEYWPARRGNCAGTPAPAGPWQPAHAGTPLARSLPCRRVQMQVQPPATLPGRFRSPEPSPETKGAILLEFPDSMRVFPDAAFLRAAGRAADFPPAGPPEIAFAGRSNVGKSSAINA